MTTKKRPKFGAVFIDAIIWVEFGRRDLSPVEKNAYVRGCIDVFHRMVDSGMLSSSAPSYSAQDFIDEFTADLKAARKAAFFA